MEVLKGNEGLKAQGAFVLGGQQMGTESGFRNVSQLWLNRTQPIDEAIEIINAERKNREDIMVKVSQVKPVVVDGADGPGLRIVIGDGRMLVMTEHAVNQLAMKLEVPTTFTNTYLNPKMHPTKKEVIKYNRDRQDFELVAMGLANGLRRRDPNDDFLFRIYNGEHCRAVLSDRYSIVDNVWYLEILKSILSPDARISHWRGNADTVIGNVLIPDTIRAEADSDYGGMLSLSNCEIGKRVIAQVPSIFRAICMNGCIWGQEKGIGFRKRHKGIDLVELADRIKDNVTKQIPLLGTGIDMLLVTQSWKAETKMFNLMTQLAYDFKCSNRQIVDIAEEWVKQGRIMSAFGMIDAVTRVGQTQSAEDWVNFDTNAGLLLNRKYWDTLNAKAKAITEEEVHKVFLIEQK